MPTYEYKCQECGHELEAFQSMKADPLTDCPSCGHSTLKRKIGRGAGIIFKGSGFYQTDYRSSAGASASPSESSAKESSGGCTTCGSDTPCSTQSQTTTSAHAS